MHLPADTNAQIDTFTWVHACINVPAVLDVLLALQDQANQQHPEKYKQKVHHALFLFVPFAQAFLYSSQSISDSGKSPRLTATNKAWNTRYFRLTLSPWYPISPGSPRFPTSPWISQYHRDITQHCPAIESATQSCRTLKAQKTQLRSKLTTKTQKRPPTTTLLCYHELSWGCLSTWVVHLFGFLINLRLLWLKAYFLDLWHSKNITQKLKSFYFHENHCSI